MFFFKRIFVGYWFWNSHICSGGLAIKKGFDYRTCSQVR